MGTRLILKWPERHGRDAQATSAAREHWHDQARHGTGGLPGAIRSLKSRRLLARPAMRPPAAAVLRGEL